MRRKDQERYQREYEELHSGYTEQPTSGFVDDEDRFAYNRRQRLEAQRRAEERERRYQLYLMEQEKERKRAKTRRILLAVVAVLFVIAAAVFVLWRSWARKPSVKTERPALVNADGNISRGEDCFTLLIAGKDKAAGLTDTILLGKFDAKNHSAHFYSIPRDTCVNEDWTTKKVNQYYVTAGGGDAGVEAMIQGMKKLLGFRVDHYMIIDLDAFVEIVDTIGGVEFDVPIDMNYDDPDQELWIHVQKGPQTLNGIDAMGVWRYRSTYVNGDIGRLDVQHDLLKAVVKQTLTVGNIKNLDEIIAIINRRVETDLSSGNLAYFAEQFLQMKEENITFETAPGNYNGEMNKLSYVFLYPEEWLVCINRDINPYDVEISLADLDVVYESGGVIYSTSGSLANNFPQ